MARLTTFRNEGLTFDVTDTGPLDGDVVLLLHGYPETKESWDAVAPVLADAGYRVLAPDQRGYSPGARPRGRRSYTVDHLVGDALALADAAAAPRVHLVGHDWGGIVGWAVAMRHPGRLASLTSLTTPHPSAFARSLVRSTQLLRSWYVLFYQLPLLPELMTGTAVGRTGFRRQLVASGLDPARADRYVELLSSGAAGPAVNWYRGLPLAAPTGTFGEVTVPTLYVYAGGDFALSRRAAEDTGRYVTGDYRFEVVEGASHWLPEESAEEITPMILEHLAAHPATSTPLT